MHLDRVMRTIVPGLADFCLIYLLDGDDLTCVASAHRTREGDRTLRALLRVYKITRDDPDSTVAQAIRLGRPSLRTEIRPEQAASRSRFTRLARIFDLHRQLAIRSALVVPIDGSSGVIGAVALSYAESGRQYKPSDIAVVEHVAHRLALAIDNARLVAAQRQQAVLGRRARPALTRLRQAVHRLRSADSRRERTRLLSEVARHERMLARMLERYIAVCPPPAPRANRLRVRS